MKTELYHSYLRGVLSLNTLQYRELKELIESIDSVKYVARIVETKFSEIECPHCSSKNILRWGKRNDLQRYKCKRCKKTFNSLTGTPLAKLHKKGRWLDFAESLKNGATVRAAALKCCVDKTTSFRWRHRFLKLTDRIKPELLSGIVEADEVFFAKSFKGSHQVPRESHKRGCKSVDSLKAKEKVCLFVSRDRNKNTFDKIFNKFSIQRLKTTTKGLFCKDSLICSDKKDIYINYIQQNNMRHGCLDYAHGVTSKKDVVHIYNVKNYELRLLNWMERFHGVATKYLHNYIAWFRGLDEFDMDISKVTILLRAKIGGRYNTNHYR